MTLYCIDTSARHHATDPRVAEVWRRHLQADEPGICDRVRLEILFSARSARDSSAQATVLHYDDDYARIAAVTGRAVR